MQELRSTEILEKEIQEDVKQKILEIQQNCDIQCKEILDSVQIKIAEAEKEKTEFLNKKIEVYRKNKNASLPLEKKRYEVSYIQNLILENINEFLQNLTEEKRIQLVLKKLEENQTAELIKENKFIAFVYGFNFEKAEAELKKMLGKNLLKTEKTEFGKLILEDDNIQLKQGVILESEDKKLRFRLTISEIVAHLLDKNRAELTNTLLGMQG